MVCVGRVKTERSGQQHQRVCQRSMLRANDAPTCLHSVKESDDEPDSTERYNEIHFYLHQCCGYTLCEAHKTRIQRKIIPTLPQPQTHSTPTCLNESYNGNVRFKLKISLSTSYKHKSFASSRSSIFPLYL